MAMDNFTPREPTVGLEVLGDETDEEVAAQLADATNRGAPPEHLAALRRALGDGFVELTQEISRKEFERQIDVLTDAVGRRPGWSRVYRHEMEAGNWMQRIALVSFGYYGDELTGTGTVIVYGQDSVFEAIVCGRGEPHCFEQQHYTSPEGAVEWIEDMIRRHLRGPGATTS